MEMPYIAVDYSSEGLYVCWALLMSLLVSAFFIYIVYSFTSNIPSSSIHDVIEVQWPAWPGRYDICSGIVRLRINFRYFMHILGTRYLSILSF